MLIETLKTNIKEAMKEKLETKNSIKYSVYKNILDKAQKDAKEKKQEINDEFVIAAARKELKQLEDTLSYVKMEDSVRYNELLASIKIVEDFLPRPVSKDEILIYLEHNNIEKNMGDCMRILKANFGANLDGKMASEVVKEYIK